MGRIIMQIEEDVTVDVSVLVRNSAISFLDSHALMPLFFSSLRYK